MDYPRGVQGIAFLQFESVASDAGQSPGVSDMETLGYTIMGAASAGILIKALSVAASALEGAEQDEASAEEHEALLGKSASRPASSNGTSASGGILTSTLLMSIPSILGS